MARALFTPRVSRLTSVVLTVLNDPDYTRAALAAGAIGYVVKTPLSTGLVSALHAAFRDTRFISPGSELEGVE